MRLPRSEGGRGGAGEGGPPTSNEAFTKVGRARGVLR